MSKAEFLKIISSVGIEAKSILTEEVQSYFGAPVFSRIMIAWEGKIHKSTIKYMKGKESEEKVIKEKQKYERWLLEIKQG